jgi:ureidoacrylate peracid hydrolase
MTYSLETLCQEKKSALIVVDMQNDFVDSLGSFAQAGFRVDHYQQLEPLILELLDTARRNGIPVIFIGMAHSKENDGEGAWAQRRISYAHPNSCRKGSWGCEPYGQLKPLENEWWHWKHRYSAFVGTDFTVQLRKAGIETLVFTGINTNTCVESTIRDAHMHDFHVVLLKDATTCAFPDAYEPTLRNIERHFGLVVESKVWQQLYC